MYQRNAVVQGQGSLSFLRVGSHSGPAEVVLIGTNCLVRHDFSIQCKLQKDVFKVSRFDHVQFIKKKSHIYLN